MKRLDLKEQILDWYTIVLIGVLTVTAVFALYMTITTMLMTTESKWPPVNCGCLEK